MEPDVAMGPIDLTRKEVLRVVDHGQPDESLSRNPYRPDREVGPSDDLAACRTSRPRPSTAHMPRPQAFPEQGTQPLLPPLETTLSFNKTHVPAPPFLLTRTQSQSQQRTNQSDPFRPYATVTTTPAHPFAHSALGPKLAALMSPGRPDEQDPISGAPIPMDGRSTPVDLPRPRVGGANAGMIFGHAGSVSLGGTFPFTSDLGDGTHMGKNGARQYVPSSSVDPGKWLRLEENAMLGGGAREPDVEMGDGDSMQGVVYSSVSPQGGGPILAASRPETPSQCPDPNSLDHYLPSASQHQRQRTGSSSSYSPRQLGDDLHTHRPLPNWAEMATFPTVGAGTSSAYTYHPDGGHQTTQNKSPFSDSVGRTGSLSPPYSYGNPSPPQMYTHSRHPTDTTSALSVSPPTSMYGTSPTRVVSGGYLSSSSGPVRARSPGVGGRPSQASGGDKPLLRPRTSPRPAGTSSASRPYPATDIVMGRSLQGLQIAGGSIGRRQSVGRSGREMSPIDAELLDRDDPGDAAAPRRAVAEWVAKRPVRSAQEARQDAKQARIESEQRRRDELRGAFIVLKKSLPPSNQRGSKVALIERAVERIQQLEKAYTDVSAEKQHLLSENARLSRRNDKLVEAQTIQISRGSIGALPTTKGEEVHGAHTDLEGQR